MRRFIAALVLALACSVPAAEAQYRSRGSSSFGQSFTRGLGFSLGAGVGSRFIGGPFADPFAFRQPVFFQPAPLLVRPAVRFLQPLEQFDVFGAPVQTERVIIIVR